MPTFHYKEQPWPALALSRRIDFKLTHYLILSILFATTASASGYEVEGLKLGSSLNSLPKSEYACSPSPVGKDNTSCKKIKPGKLFGVPTTKIELGYKKGRLDIIFIGFAPSDTPAVGRALEKKYGTPSRAGQIFTGVYQVVWRKGDQDMTLVRDDNRGEANLTLIDFAVGEVPK